MDYFLGFFVTVFFNEDTCELMVFFFLNRVGFLSKLLRLGDFSGVRISEELNLAKILSRLSFN